jgi:hypothetical protein
MPTTLLWLSSAYLAPRQRHVSGVRPPAWERFRRRRFVGCGGAQRLRRLRPRVQCGHGGADLLQGLQPAHGGARLRGLRRRPLGV